MCPKAMRLIIQLLASWYKNNPEQAQVLTACQQHWPVPALLNCAVGQGEEYMGVI